MTKRTKYAVHYGNGEVARFTNRLHAREFAQSYDGDLIAPDGIIGQYRNGDSTPEFQDHHHADFVAA